MIKPIDKDIFTGDKVCRRAPIVSHLLFADDCFLFFVPTGQETLKMKDILATYEATSGQMMNFNNSEIFLSLNVTQDTQQHLSAFLDVRICLRTSKYLGLPSIIGRSKKSIFKFIKDRVWSRINSWSGKILSIAGREVLIKSVLQVIPSYAMSIFLIPQSLGNDIQKLMNSFWWGSGGGAPRGIHWLSWDKLSMHKFCGGMGFKNLHAFNLAMLGKQGWRLMSNPDALVSKFKSRIFSGWGFS